MNIEQQAEDLIKDIGIVIPVCPQEVCKKLSDDNFTLNYKETHISNDGFLGISSGNKFEATIVVNKNITFDSRKLFTAAHEIGHVVLHIMTEKQSEFQCTNSDLKKGDKDNAVFEYEANQFAGALLMPSHLIRDDINKNDLSWQLVGDIAVRCKTSLEATARRVITLSKEPCVLLIHQNNKPWNPVKSPSWSWYFKNPQFPDLDYCDYENLTADMEDCDLSDWDIENINNDEYQCKYSSIHFQNDSVNKIMTLLLLEEN